MKPLREQLGDRAALKLFADADHSFHVPARTERKDGEVLAELRDAKANWIGEVRAADPHQECDTT